MSRLPWLDPYDDSQPFPDPAQALAEPDGLLAAGGNLSPRRLLRAYRHGIFPWYSPGQPILWWSPDPRTILFTDRIKISRSLRKTIKQGLFIVTLNRAFAQVLQQCGAPRSGQPPGTWITPAITGLIYGCMNSAMPIRWKPGMPGNWWVVCTAWPSVGSFTANRCSAE